MNLSKLFEKWFKKSKPGKKYSEVAFVSALSDVPKNTKSKIFVVKGGDNYKWAVFACPNNCGKSIQLNLMASKLPQWELKIRKGKATIYPSIDVESCGAHFWMQDNMAVTAHH
jgi:hypothetical protein